MSRPRRLARRRAVQALYSWQLSSDNLIDIENQFLVDQDMKDVDLAYFKELLHQVPGHLDEIDEKITATIDRAFSELDPIECSIMRMAVYELLHRPDVPYRVVINEAIELAKTFGSAEGFKYVNSVVDNLAKELRTVEVNANKNSGNRTPGKKRAAKADVKISIKKKPVIRTIPK